VPNTRIWSLPIVAVAALVACGEAPDAPQAPAAAAPPAAAPPAAQPASAATPADLPNALAFALSTFETGPDGKPLPRSELMILTRKGGQWAARSYSDPESNVFHKAFAWTPPGAEPALVTLGGSAAAVKLWRKGADGLAPVETLWQADFGGKFSRMRDGEVADLYGDGQTEIVVATHDQGVVAVVRAGAETVELDRQRDTIVHEVEVGDLDGDGTPEVYATPSEPNRLDGTPQPGAVVRYVPAKGEGRKVVADLGMRHAKEILVGDVDGDGRDELYAVVEAAEGGALELKRYDADTAPTAGRVIATLYDQMARFLTAGDVDGDGRKEMVLAAKDSGLWLLRPGADAKAPWRSELIDAHSKGFEHAALLTDLDGDGLCELYVASDDDKEVRRYAWDGKRLAREVIHKRSDPLPVLTWNLAPVPLSLVE
jgi:FG-GAP-like repeat